MTDPAAFPEDPADGPPAAVDAEVDPPAPEADAAETAPAEAAAPASVEELIVDLERAVTERDEYLDALRRGQADFENYRKRSMKQADEAAERGAEVLVDKLLPVLDACDGAIAHGAKSKSGGHLGKLLG